MTDIIAERTWSLLDPRPILKYLERHDEYIVYWNGWALTHGQALCLTMETMGIYPTPEMKSALQHTFEKLYFAGAFNTRAWDDRVKSYEAIYDFQKRGLKDHIAKVINNKEPRELLSWFDYSRARGANNE
jgi:hypothetical protein